MAVAFGTRINDNTNFITEIDLDNETCETTGYINGEAVDFSGGGGSGDFSTAEVEITGMAEIYGAFLKEDETYYINDSGTVTVILYKGKATLSSLNAPENVTGDITYDSDRDEIIVTGDGTITFGGLGGLG